MLLEDAARGARPGAALTHQSDRRVGVEFAEARARSGQRHVHGTVDMADVPLSESAHIENRQGLLARLAVCVRLLHGHGRDVLDGHAIHDPRVHAVLEVTGHVVEADPPQHGRECRDLVVRVGNQDDRLFGRQDPTAEGREVVGGVDVVRPGDVGAAEAGIVARVHDDMPLLDQDLRVLWRQRTRLRQFGHEGRAIAVDCRTAGEVVGRPRHAVQERGLEVRQRLVLERGVALTFVADGARPHGTHRLPAQGARSVGGIDQARVGQLHELVMQVVEELRCQFVGHAGKEVGAAHVADEERVAGENRYGLVASRTVGHHVADAVGRVPRRVEHLDVHVFDVEAVTIANGDMVIGTLAGPGGADGCSGLPRQVQVAGHEVRVEMGFQNMRDLEAELLRGRHVFLDVALWIDDRTRRLATEQVRQVSDTIDVVLLH